MDKGDCAYKRSQSGVTLVELLIVLAVVATVAGMAAAGYSSYIDTSRIDAAKRDIIEIASHIERYHLTTNSWPTDLSTAGIPNKEDPWGNLYIYARIPTLVGQIQTGNTMIRQDANLRPINTFYDLYSKGADGDTTNNISAPKSHDDVIRARDGDFLGLARDY
ncbi:MAG: prepilin-type N-terminal cleavage/methylation domain-containing protein [Gammaproteobacteria bacterium]|nr:prepilin-type N-terminal cleavage/methylation domain-containing protein [Gammaproteobacteria bacterium]